MEQGDDLPGEVHWDADRMNEVLGNSVEAFKFTDGTGVSASVEAVEDQFSWR